MLRNLLPRRRVITAARASSPSISFFYGTLSSPPPPTQHKASVEHPEDDDDISGGVTRPSASTISIDLSGLYNPPEHSHGPSLDSELTKHLKGIIKFRGGPISVAEYMEEVLTNPRVGFYMNRDVFGVGGDFVTSPEVSQMYGEMIGVWTMCLWEQMGQPKRVNLVELGPGRGTLTADLLRGASKFKHFTQSLQIHMVECSPTLRKLQHQTLKCIDEESIEKKTISSLAGSPASWHATLDEVPSGVPAIIIVHEFYDALPVHQFQDFSWLVRENGGYPRRFNVSILFTSHPVFHGPCVVWSPINQRKPLFLFLLDQEVSGINHMEICPKAMDLTQTIAKRIGSDGGGALIIDYGLNKLVSDSLQAIRKHKFVHILDDPGSADLSAYVDFAAIRHSAEEVSDDVSIHGPITQSQLLGALGINFRVEALLKNCNEEQAESLRAGYWRLVGDGEAPFWEGPDEQVPMGMGTRYLAMAIVNKSHGVPVPFTGNRGSSSSCQVCSIFQS